MKADSEIDIRRFNKRRMGWTGAQIANFVNTAAINAVKHSSKTVRHQDLDYAYDR